MPSSTRRPADEAFKIFQEESVDLILSDWAPGLDGITFINRVRRDIESPDPYVPIIMVTGNTELHHIYQARDAGMTEFLAKPISANLIYARIRSVIERHWIFIQSGDFFGPDRRRRRVGFKGRDQRDHVNYQGPDRRVEDLPFEGEEKRQGYTGFTVSEPRDSER
jgi:two-component system, chemotaxis family, chemotaxis protein CheY